MAEGLTQEAAAAKVGMSVRTARVWKDGPLPSEARAPRDWRTRADPFEGVWEALLEPLLLADTDRQLEAPTLLDVITEKHPGRFSRKHLRPLQRRRWDRRAMP